MANDLKIAVIITCYNYELYVGHAIQSVINQECPSIEIVVVDDGSTDGSWEVIKKYGVTAYRIKNCGQRLACLHGLAQTTAPFVLFLDADDELMPGALQKIIPQLSPEVAKLQFRLRCVDHAGKTLRTGYPDISSFRGRSKLQAEVLRTAVYQTPPTSGNVFRRDLCQILKDVDYESAVDGVILFIAPFIGEIVSLSEDLGVYRIHGKNESGLGRPPDAKNFERDLIRFRNRVEHLNVLIKVYCPDAQLVDYRRTLHYRITQFYASVESRRPYDLRSFKALLSYVISERRSASWRIGTSMYLIAMYSAPKELSRRMLNWRLSTKHYYLKFLLNPPKRPS